MFFHKLADDNGTLPQAPPHKNINCQRRGFHDISCKDNLSVMRLQSVFSDNLSILVFPNYKLKCFYLTYLLFSLSKLWNKVYPSPRKTQSSKNGSTKKNA